MGEVMELLAEARHEMTIFNRPSKRTSLRMIEALTTAQAEIEALKAELAAALAKVDKLREGLQDIAWPARLPSDGDPTVLRNHALATLAETQP